MLNALSTIAAITLMGLLAVLVASFYFLDRLIRHEYSFHREAWERDGRPTSPFIPRRERTWFRERHRLSALRVQLATVHACVGPHGLGSHSATSDMHKNARTFSLANGKCGITVVAMSSPKWKISVVAATVAATLFAASAEPASLTVTNTGDDGVGSLRNAVLVAAAGDTIEFNLPSDDPGYDSSAGVFIITLTSGEIMIERDLIIAGPSAANVAVSGNDSSRIFRVTVGQVAISNLSFLRGRARGADGTGSGSSDPGKSGVGGAVLNHGTLTFSRCTFEGNNALGGDGATGGTQDGGRGGDALGGAIANYNQLSLMACTLASNSTTGGRGGVGGFGVSNGSAPTGIASGGAVYNADTGVLSVINCTITDNRATTPDVIYRGAFGNARPREAVGGGIANVGRLIMVHSTVAGNTAATGRYEFNGQPASRIESFGGGLYAAENSVSSLRDNIIAGNQMVPMPGTPQSGSSGPDVNGAVTSEGHNLIGRSDGCTGFTANDLQGGTTEETRLDPKLGPLGHHGGSTKTLPLLADSPAIDAADNAPPDRDQRGLRRRGQADIGAFEYDGAEPVVLGNISTRARIQTGDNAMIGGFIITGTETKTLLIRAVGPSLNLPGQLDDPIIEVYQGDGGLIATNDNWQDAGTRQQIVDSGLAPKHEREPALWGVINPGTYTVVVRGKNNTSGIGLVEVYDLDREVDSAFANISTRAVVESGDNVMIGGFIIVSDDARTVIVRALGPSMSAPGTLADPTLELYDANGALLADNDNWRDEQETEIINTTIPPSDDSESAIVRQLAPGAYTAVVRGANQAIGVALVEVYALD